MERLLRKGALYGFLIGLGVAILFVSNKETENLGNGVTSISNLPLIDYIILLLRYGVVGSFGGLVIAGYLFLKHKDKGKQ